MHRGYPFFITPGKDLLHELVQRHCMASAALGRVGSDCFYSAHVDLNRRQDTIGSYSTTESLVELPLVAYSETLGEFVLKYKDIRLEPSPDRAVLDFYKVPTRPPPSWEVGPRRVGALRQPALASLFLARLRVCRVCRSACDNLDS